MLDNGLGVVGILLDVADEPPDRLLVILVLLALNDDLHNASANEYETRSDGTDLLHAVDELVTTLLGEVLLGEEVVGTITLLASLVLALIGHTVNKVVLRKQKAVSTECRITSEHSKGERRPRRRTKARRRVSRRVNSCGRGGIAGDCGSS
jgi:hypothetical protein